MRSEGEGKQTTTTRASPSSPLSPLSFDLPLLHEGVRNGLAGAVAGLAATLGCHPIDTVKVVMQTSSAGSGSKGGMSAMAALRTVIDSRSKSLSVTDVVGIV